MLNHGEAVAAIIPSTFRGHDFAAMYDDIRSKVPSLEHIIAIGDDGSSGFEALLSGPTWENETDAESILTGNRPSADDVTQLIYLWHDR